MPMLKLDQFGRLYQTSPDREDGGGYHSHAHPVSQGDVTFGSVHSRALDAQKRQTLRGMKILAIEDGVSEHQAQLGRAQRAQRQAQTARDEQMGDDENYVIRLKREGARQAQMGCECESYPGNGNDHSANGLGGKMGHDQLQKILSGMGDPAPVDATEAYQAQMYAIAQNMIMQQARLDAARNSAEASNWRKTPTVPTPSVQQDTQQIPVHPMASMVLATS